MKKLSILTCTAILLTVVLFSCKKLVEVFGGIDAAVPTITFLLPPIPIILDTSEIPGGTVSVAYNLDSNIRAATAQVFGLKDVTSIKLKQAELTAVNADANNNLSNFKTFRMTLRSNFNSNTNSTAVNFFSMAFPDSLPPAMLKKYTAVATSDDELIEYLKGSTIYYNVYGKLRRPTSTALNMSLVIILKVR